MNKDKTRASIMSLAGIYLAYLGGSLIKDVLEARPDNYILFVVLGTVFVIVGVYVVITKAKIYMELQKEDMRLAQEEWNATDVEQEESENEEMNSEQVTEEQSAEEQSVEEQEDTPTDAFEREVERFIDKFGENQNAE